MEYPKGASNTVHRIAKRAKYDHETVHSIVNSTSILHVSFIPSPTDPYPTPIILPMIGQMGYYPSSNDDAESCYLHGYVSSRLMRLADEAVKAGQPGLPVCVAATQVNGFVLALTPFHNSYNYRSAVLQGTATVVDDEAEKMWALELITDSVVPKIWENSRTPPDNAEMKSTRVLKVKVETASGKVRDEQPGDDRKDLKREGLVEKVWTGVVPVYQRMGEPVPSSYNKVQAVPEHIGTYIKTQNAEREEYAIAAGKNTGKKKSDD